MDKQKQIEEMVEVMANWAYRNGMLWHEGHAKILAETLIENDYEKIPEKAVVVSKQVWEEHIKNWDKTIKAVEERAQKEIAEKFAERLKALVADRNCNEDYDWEDVQVDGQIFIECVDEICKEITEG